MNERAAERFREMCITVLYSGYAPIASGSWGSLAAVGLYAALLMLTRRLPAGDLFLDPLTVVGVLLASLAAVKFGPWAITRYNSLDPKQFVLDEFAGQWVALLLMPGMLLAGVAEAGIILAGQFVLFRVIDVLKPPPARQFEQLPRGWGILVDDLMAGVYANLIGQVLWRVWPAERWSAWIGL